MSDKDERPAEETPKPAAQDDDPEMRPLPDGGLGENMPDWLRRPPAWRVLPATQMPAFEPDPETTTPPRELPPEDTSVIEPTSLIEFDDLPRWLRELGTQRLTREDEMAETVDASVTDGEDLESSAPLAPESAPSAVPEPSSADAAPQGDALPEAEEPAPVLPSSPEPAFEPSPVETSTPPELKAVPAPPAQEIRFWQRGEVVLLLVAGLLVAVVVAILLATGVL